MTTLPAAMLIFVCLFLPHQRNCSSHVEETPFDTGLFVAIVPLVLIGLLPVAWRLSASVRCDIPELALAATMLAMALLVVTIPVAIYLMWGYSKRQFRGEVLTAMCSVSLVAMWLFVYPLLTLFDTWLPAAQTTWGAACVLLFGLLVWTSAAVARPKNVVEAPPLQREHILGLQIHV
ncbi:MAG: hypothetical protein M4D80_31035 [Myxococcota bacterium]|nr:hypothetical protein [Deltaproteobacteria bacterium]MDQ3339624.1 hypothetical protein [Myxococcota bacterium]